MPAVCPYAGQHLLECYPKFHRKNVWLAKMLSRKVIQKDNGAKPELT